VEVAVQPDRTLSFCKRSVDGSAKATLVPALGSRAFGAVYRIDESEKALLDRAEGLGQGYDELWQGLPLSEGVVRSFLYAAADDYVDRSLKPYHWYKELVLAGARFHDLPAAYIAGIEAIDSVDDPNPDRRAKNEALLQSCGSALAREEDLRLQAQDSEQGRFRQRR
jgi:hypothetical protein